MKKFSLSLRPPLGVANLFSGLTMLYWAWHLKHPLMMSFRPVETPLLVVSSVICLALAIRQRQFPRQRVWGTLSVLTYAAVLLVTISQEGYFQWQRYRVLQAAPLSRALGGHFVIGFRDYESLAPLAEKGLIGGIYLTRRNVAGQHIDEVREQINKLQALRLAKGLPPLFVAADQEGGTVNHLSPLLPAHPPLAELATLNPKMRAKAAYAYGQQQGAELTSLGVNLNLSPVVDLKPARHGWWLDTHTLTHQRAISGDAEVVRQIATAYSAGMQTTGVQATLKHFPGLGPVKTDTHHTPAHLALPLKDLAKEWAPFEQITRQTGSAIMVAHVNLDAIDARHPASQSRAVIAGTLRRQWDYQGLILTDDLNMGAVYRLGIGQSVTASLNAGADLVLVTYDPDQYYRALYEAVQRYRHGAIDDQFLVSSRERIRRHWAQREKTHSKPVAT